jgi:hypothetical protein
VRIYRANGRRVEKRRWNGQETIGRESEEVEDPWKSSEKMEIETSEGAEQEREITGRRRYTWMRQW